MALPHGEISLRESNFDALIQGIGILTLLAPEVQFHPVESMPPRDAGRGRLIQAMAQVSGNIIGAAATGDRRPQDR